MLVHSIAGLEGMYAKLLAMPIWTSEETANTKNSLSYLLQWALFVIYLLKKKKNQLLKESIFAYIC